MSRLMRPSEVARELGISKYTLLRLEEAGRFPRRIRIGARAVAYDSDEIDEWKARCKAERHNVERRPRSRHARNNESRAALWP